jgi:hypothetical protein
MRFRYILISMLVLATLTLVASPGQATRPTPQQGTLRGTTQQVIVGSKLESMNPICTLGVIGPASFPMFYLYPPEDQYYTLIDPAQCGCQGSGGALLSTAHVMLDFPEACTIPVRVGIVAADLSNPECPAPIMGQYLCPPVDQDLSVTEAGQYDFALPLGAVCCITQKAFLMITFVTGGDCGSWPGLMIDTAVCGCVSYNAWPDGELYDLCGTLPGSPVMYVEAGCCGEVSTTPQSWGHIKAMYR